MAKTPPLLPLTLLAAAAGGRPALWPGAISIDRHDHVQREIEHHGLSALIVYQHGKHRNLADWPTELLQLLRAHGRSLAANDLLLEAELSRVLDHCADAELPCLLTKGGLLAYTLYPYPSLRPRCDHDLWIESNAKQTLFDLLSELGYRKQVSHDADLVTNQCISLRTDQHGLQHVFDIHWQLFNRGALRDTLDWPTAYAMRRPVTQLGERAYGLSSSHALIHACLHKIAHHDDEDRLIWLYDIALLCASLTRAEQEHFVCSVQEKRIVAGCMDALVAADAMFPGQTTALLQRLKNSSVSHDISAELLTQRSRLELLRSELRSHPLLRNRLRLLWQHAFPSASYMRHRYGITRSWQLPYCYLRRLARGGARLLQQRPQL